MEWLHPESGRYYPQPLLSAATGPCEFQPPELEGDDWVLHLRKRSSP